LPERGPLESQGDEGSGQADRAVAGLGEVVCRHPSCRLIVWCVFFLPSPLCRWGRQLLHQNLHQERLFCSAFVWISDSGTASAGSGDEAPGIRLLTIEQEMEEIVIIPARGFALACNPRLAGFVRTQEGDRQPMAQRPVGDPVTVALAPPALMQ